jgi:hypothetical protein
MQPCIFCGRTDGRPSKEHAIPKWARGTFDMSGSVNLRMRIPGREMETLHTRPHLNVVLEKQICEECNNTWLSELERDVSPFLAPMAKEFTPTHLDVRRLTLLATWAVKTSFLFERSVRQKYPQRPVDGTPGSAAELAWLWKQRTPPPKSLVWLACFDCQHSLAVTYEPSGAPLLCRDGSIMAGHLVTIALGYVAFQCFVVDFLAAELAGAWRGWPPMPENIRPGIVPIWPNPTSMDWPPPAFTRESWDKLVTWDGALRTGGNVEAEAS